MVCPNLDHSLPQQGKSTNALLAVSLIDVKSQVDIFKSRILISRISKYFPDYEGDYGDYNAAKEYFKLRFTRLNRSQNKEICTFDD